MGLMSRAPGNLAGLAAGSSGVGSSVLPRDGASVAVVADETPYRLAFTLATLHVKRNALAAAARVLRSARERTRDEAHRFLSDHLLARIGAVASGQGEARGTPEAVECLAGGALAFRVRAAFGLLRLAADSPCRCFSMTPKATRWSAT
ncbi:MAG TPA: hypothetical protein VGR25_08635 [bacterium]|nr:hypothetical protein [bacterium]